ncbi:thioesterase domain-containing protein [Colletotrichum sp. SAR 10_65]|nr:thioesterase domain-containing protein [Colletotrichum sp. SAR 10_65]
MEISYRDIDFGGTFQIYCSLLEVKGAFLADAIVMDTSGQVIAAVRGMEFRRLRLSTFQQMLALPIDLITPSTSTKGTNTPPESRTKSTQDVDMALKKIVMDVGGFSIEDMDYNKPLDELGIDSLMQIEIAFGLARAFPFADKMNHRWSFGGVVAFEAARQLLSKGFEVKGLVLIDSPSPVNHKPLPKEIITSITSSNRSDGQPQEGKHNAALEEEFQRNASLLERYGADPSAMTRMPGLKTVMLRSQDVMDTESLVGLRCDWLSNQNDRDASIAAWENLVCGHIKVLPIPGNHFEAFSPANIAETGSQLWKACQHIESS